MKSARIQRKDWILMITLTVDPKVEQALHLAFPRPANSATKALGKYVKLLERMLLEAHVRGINPAQRKTGTFGLSLSRLQSEGGQIGSRRVRVHKWLNDNGTPLVEVVELGSNLTGLVSQVKLSNLVTLNNKLEVDPSKLAKNLTDRQIDDYLSGDHASNSALFKALYPDFRSDWTAEELYAVFDRQDVDVKSLKAFIVWLGTEATLFNITQRENMLRQAKIVLAITQTLGGGYLQRKNPSQFGRMYYDGVNIQSVHKELRRAILGDCWEYDIRSSVVAWKMGFAKALIDQYSPGTSIREVFGTTLNYLEDKVDFMATVRTFVFTTASRLTKELQLKLLKQAFTAIGFGAKLNETGWMDEAGQWNNPALVNILKNSADRERFVKDISVKKFIEEQRILDEFIYQLVSQHRPDILANPYVQNKTGAPNRSKVLAYMYQHGESAVMDVVREIAKAHDRVPLACVHDAIFFKKRLGVDLKTEIEMGMRDATGNPYWHLTPKEIKRYETQSIDALREEQEHKKRIREEEEFSRFYKAKFSFISMSTDDPPDHRGTV